MKRHLSIYHTQIWLLYNSHLQHVFVFGIKITFIHGIFCIQHNFKNTCICIFCILYQLLKNNLHFIFKEKPFELSNLELLFLYGINVVVILLDKCPVEKDINYAYVKGRQSMVARNLQVEIVLKCAKYQPLNVSFSKI